MGVVGVDPDVAESDEGETATAQVLLDSYLPGAGTLSSQVSSQMVRLFTDLHFLSPIDKVVREMANTTERLYYYNYQHQGSFTLPMAYGFWEVSQRDVRYLQSVCLFSELRRQSRGRALPAVPGEPGVWLLARGPLSPDPGGLHRLQEAGQALD